MTRGGSTRGGSTRGCSTGTGVIGVRKKPRRPRDPIRRMDAILRLMKRYERRAEEAERSNDIIRLFKATVAEMRLVSIAREIRREALGDGGAGSHAPGGHGPRREEAGGGAGR
ncbi:MAG: hypothetical protein QJR08_00370 [Bacillota bacterium]|nr:hypothetical protein [Bacillota bacterium]